MTSHLWLARWRRTPPKNPPRSTTRAWQQCSFTTRATPKKVATELLGCVGEEHPSEYDFEWGFTLGVDPGAAEN